MKRKVRDAPALSRPTILVVDDNEALLEALSIGLAEKYRVLVAAKHETVLQILEREQEPIAIILMDGCLDERSSRALNGRPDTLELIRRIKDRGFTGRLIATSQRSEFRLMQMQAGCHEQCEKKRLLTRMDELHGSLLTTAQ